MAAECYWCKAGNPTIVNTLGGVDRPIGCCSKCQALICGHHGQRDPILRSFMCFDCDISILVNSAVSLSGQNLSGTEFGDDFDFYFTVNRALFYLFKSFDDFKRHRPGYEGWFDEMAANRVEFSPHEKDTTYGRLFSSLTPEGRKLLGAASFIISHLYDSVDVKDMPAYYSLLRNDSQLGI